MQVHATLNAWFSSLTARRGERGATAVEYGLIVALIAVAIIAAVTLLGDELTDLFGTVSNEVGNANPSPSASAGS
ncbi:Flp family type IVb pilin [Aeromicrobium phragmitis]|uniref:Flp family type IVb pilin n=1 Tax=Aeromicrobium phragmitis TaxID=2478914 RepID=A0A3L8PQE2_9ACTN|nr:Flp family type IVb pilin [Aeromicrobium phragmitis]RLV56678.1 Flp family type IVb pilin [Aeromicrobium phragmitis]